ncbi:MAG: tRNA (N(6)-L-threonylcarbamoyladenosine(37)-C(2))-methylthiotransferase MtaB [Clostridia bacterium]|nr:tRNA (N(6)-L-threonylcarbamoyladenosine(37)-C(2))-methylthiotransferase MtaB [Clostridia bacterium]
MKVCIITLGCKQNKYESDCMANILKTNGYEITTNLEYADVYLVNTCAVTQEAEKKSRQYIAKINKLNSNAKIIICGCASENDLSQFDDKKNVFSIIGNEGKEKILDILNNATKQVFDINHSMYPNLSSPTKTTTRAHLKIQDGCNNFCSYCLIPYLRGRSRSRDIEEIILEAKELSKHSEEIVLTGIDISSFKVDGKLALPTLMSRLKDIPSTIRIGSLEVNVITTSLMEVLSSMSNFAPHFHLSLQSGCDKVLEKMNRHYTTQEYYDKVCLIRQYFPDANITTDVIVGFPNETDECFEETMRFVNKVKFSFMHIFPYSPRKGTLAYKYKDLPKDIKAKRVDMLEEINNVNKKLYLNKFKGKTLRVLLEETKSNKLVGYTKEYIRVYVDNLSLELGKYYDVKVLDHYLDGVVAEIV